MFQRRVAGLTGPLIVLCLAACASASPPAAPPVARFWIQGDTQSMARPYGASRFERWIDQNEWVCAQKDAKSVKGVLHTGDIVQYQGAPEQWDHAHQAFAVLDGCGLGYITPAGNHDYLTQGDEKHPPRWSAYDAFMAKRDVTRPSTTSRVATHPDRRVWIESLWDAYYVVALPYKATDREETWAIAAAQQVSHPKGPKFILLQHFSAARNGIGNPRTQRFIRRFEANPGLDMVAVIGGHVRGLPRTAYKVWNAGRPRAAKPLLSVYSNFQDQEDGYVGGVFDRWGTWLEIHADTGELCVWSESVTGERDIFGGRVCWTP